MKRMKKISLLVMISFLIFTNCPYALAATATVNVTAVRVRESASTEASIVTNLYQQDEVEILEENGEWYKVQYGDKVGYAKSEFFTQKGETTQAPEPPVNTPSEEPEETTPENSSEIQAPTTQEPTNTAPVSTKQAPNLGEKVTLSNAVKIRLLPNLAIHTKTEIAKGTSVTVEAKLGNWYKIADENGAGWITSSKFIVAQTVDQQPPVTPPETTTIPEPPPPDPEPTTPPETVPPEQSPQEPTPETPPAQTATNKTGIVIVETARVRSAASASSSIVDVLDEDDVVNIVGEEGSFYKITTDTITNGYISKTLVKESNVTSRSSTEERKTPEVTQMPETPENTVVTTKQEVVTFAKQYLGYPYVLGCSSPEKGFDCSGFTRYVFGHFGYTLGSVAASQTSLGAVVERENLQTGDLILFYNDGKTKIGHCGIYMDGGDFIHSANPQRGVVIDNLNTSSYYSQRFVTARRMVP